MLSLVLSDSLTLDDSLALVEALVLADVLALVEALVLAEVLALVEALVLADVLALVDALVLADDCLQVGAHLVLHNLRAGLQHLREDLIRFIRQTGYLHQEILRHSPCRFSHPLSPPVPALPDTSPCL